MNGLRADEPYSTSKPSNWRKKIFREKTGANVERFMIFLQKDAEHS